VALPRSQINKERSIVQVVNLLGANVIKNASGLILEFYDDGAVEKKFIVK